MLWFRLLQNGTYRAQPVNNKEHFRDKKKKKKKKERERD